MGLLSLLAGWGAATAMAATARPAITGLAYVRFYEDDMIKARQFYGERLGLAETLTPDGGASYAVGLRQRIEIAPMPAGAASHLAAVGFLTKDVAGMRRYLEEHGLKIEASGADEIAVRDPEGNLRTFVGENRAAAMTGAPAGTERHSEMVASGQPGAPTSRRMIHAGWQVRSQAAEDKFYRDLLGFRPYWHGGMKEGTTDWVSVQVPEGTDWVEYMLGAGEHPDQRQMGVLDHTSLAAVHITDVTKQLIANGMTEPAERKSQIGKDGKWQLNVFDPDLSRVEFMEYTPVQKPCCSEYTGKQPSPNDGQ